MKRTTKYVAFDVHQATTVASVRDDSGRVLARSVLETSTRLIELNGSGQRAHNGVWTSLPVTGHVDTPRAPGCALSTHKKVNIIRCSGLTTCT